MKINSKTVLISLFLMAGLDGAVYAESDVETAAQPTNRDLFFDREDNMLDLSPWLTSARGFLPTGSIITEPAVGYGGVLGLMFLHDSIANRAEQAADRDDKGMLKKITPPSITGLMGFATENGSWDAGAAHLHIFNEDRMRYMGGLFYQDVKLDYYGKGGDLNLPIDRVGYDLDGYGHAHPGTRWRKLGSHQCPEVGWTPGSILHFRVLQARESN